MSYISDVIVKSVKSSKYLTADVVAPVVARHADDVIILRNWRDLVFLN